jgi:hypothetical protein
MSYSMKTHHALCEAGVLERPRYFPGQLMTPDELSHNRLLHGWGVVCGAIVCRVPIQEGNGSGSAKVFQEGEDPCSKTQDDSSLDPWRVSVSPGYILGPQGDEIVIGCETIVDVRHACTTGVSGDSYPPAADPWCSQVTVERRPGPVYLAVRYKEIMTRPVRSQPAGCGCDETACEYSRIRDGFEICTLDDCPESHMEEPPDSEKCELRACPPCPEEPWVVLARIDLDTNGITRVDRYSCRRVVFSLANFWCRPEEPGQGDAILQDKTIREADVRKVVVEHTNLSEDDLRDAESLRAVMTLSAIELHDIGPSSFLGKKLQDDGITIGDVARMEQHGFIEYATQDASEARRTQVADQAAQVWERASRVWEAIEPLMR